MIKIRNKCAGNRYEYKQMHSMNVGNPVRLTKGKIVGVNLKKTFVTKLSDVFYGLFVHIKIENGDQYTFIFDPFVGNPGLGGASKLTGNSKINASHCVSWKRIKKAYHCFKKIRKETSKLGEAPAERFIRFSYMPTILRLMEICGADEAVDIIGKEVIISALDPSLIAGSDASTSSNTYCMAFLTMFMASLGKDDTIDLEKRYMCPILYYIDTDNEIINAFIDRFISRYPTRFIPAYGHEAEE